MAKKETEILNINVPVELMDRVRQYSEKMSINKTSAVAVLMTQALDNQRAMNDLSKFVEMYEKEKMREEN